MKSFAIALSAGMAVATLGACSSTRAPDMAAYNRSSASADMSASSASTATIASGNVSQSQLERFARAAPKVRSIADQASASEANARPEQQARIEEAANGSKARAVWQEGLTVPQFNAINAAVQSDPSLMQQYSQLTWSNPNG